MKDNKLISMVEFVIENYNNEMTSVPWRAWIHKYAQFLSQNLSEPYVVNGVTAHPLNRFVPTDEDGNVLEEPKSERCCDGYDCGCQGQPVDFESHQYRQAKERVLFEGLIDNEVSLNVLSNLIGKLLVTIEDIQKYYDVTLTQTALKMIGL